MAKLSDVLNTLATGDVVVTYYPEAPPPSRRLLHVTVILRAAHSGGAGDCFAHSDNVANELHRSPFTDYAEQGGFLVAQCVDREQAQRAANAARVWASTAQKTSYGQSPQSSDLKTPDVKLRLAASRFMGMKDIGSLLEIPFESAALLRLLKWTLRLKDSVRLSNHRGVTCAAFLAECHQAAAMLDHITLAGGLHKLDTAFVGQVAKLFESKTALRERLNLVRVELKEGSTSGKDHAFVGQAMRENSNRSLKPEASVAVTNKQAILVKRRAEYDAYETSGRDLSQIPEVEMLWVVLQHQLGIHPAAMKPLEQIIPPDFLFDAKYVNSRLMTTILRNSPHWRTTPYDRY